LLKEEIPDSSPTLTELARGASIFNATKNPKPVSSSGIK
jgi:hypothetical protein